MYANQIAAYKSYTTYIDILERLESIHGQDDVSGRETIREFDVQCKLIAKFKMDTSTLRALPEVKGWRHSFEDLTTRVEQE